MSNPPLAKKNTFRREIITPSGASFWVEGVEIPDQEMERLEDHELLSFAINIAAIAHIEQKDKQEQPYILHVLSVVVSPRLTSVFERVCAALHDVVEDSNLTLADLQYLGMPLDVVEVVRGVTREKDFGSYEWYIKNKVMERMTNRKVRLARMRVKLADLDHHMVGIHSLTDADRKRLVPRYIKAIEDIEKEMADYAMA